MSQKFIAKMVENGRKLVSPAAYDTVDEARTVGRRMWQTNQFDVIEINAAAYADDPRLYDAIRYVSV